jgi:hypothetical protein
MTLPLSGTSTTYILFLKDATHPDKLVKKLVREFDRCSVVQN